MSNPYSQYQKTQVMTASREKVLLMLYEGAIRFTKHALEPEAWAKLRLPRHALHAAKISFVHPTTKTPFTVDSPLPRDLRAFVETR